MHVPAVDASLNMVAYKSPRAARYPPALAPRTVDDRASGSSGAADTDSGTSSSITPSTSTSTSASSSSTSLFGNNAVLPALVAVAIFVFATIVALKLLQHYRNHRRSSRTPRPPGATGGAQPSLPEKPRMWEVSLAEATATGDSRPPSVLSDCSSLKWRDLMPVTVEFVPDTEADARSRKSRRASALSSSTRSSSTSRSSRGSRQSDLSLSHEKFAAYAASFEGRAAPDDTPPMRVAVLVAMPAPRAHPQGHDHTPSPTCLGVAEMY